MLLPGDDSKDGKGMHINEIDKRARLADVEDSDAKQEQNEPSKTNKQENAQSSQGAVRFAAEDEEIDPLDGSRRISEAGESKKEELSPEAHEQIRSLAMSLQKSRLQENRMANFAYEPVSMPPSRVCGMLFSI